MLRVLTAIVATALALTGCASHLAPQSRQEFIEKVKEGGMLLMLDSYVANKGFDQVVASLTQYSGCLNVDAHISRRSGGVATMNITHHSRTALRVTAPGRAELTTQFTSSGTTYLQQVPQGGFYEQAVDIERVSSTTTRLTYYGSSVESSKKVWTAIKQWSDGQAASCPD